MLKQNKTIAIIMAFIFCLTFLAPAFVAPPAAEAAMTATVAQSNFVTAASGQALGYFKVEVDVADWTAPGISGSALLVSFPSRLTTGSVITPKAAHDGANALNVIVPNGAANALTEAALKVTQEVNGGFTITLGNKGLANPAQKGVFYVHFDRVNTSNYAGDVNVTLVPKAGTAFGSTPIPLVVGKVAVSGTTTSAAKSVSKINSAGGAIDTISIFENMPNTIGSTTHPTATSRAAISLELVTKGYTWQNQGAGVAGRAFSLFNFVGNTNLPAPAIPVPAPTAGSVLMGGGTETASFTLIRNAAASQNSAGGISIGGLRIQVDEKVAKVGQDIEVKVSGNNGVTEQVIVVGQYVDFVASVVEDTTTELTSGLAGQKLGTFFIEEVAPGTLIAERTILFELPAGVEWSTNSIATSNYELVNNSAMTFSAGRLLDARTLKFDIPVVGGVAQNSSAAQNGAKVKFKGLEVDVSPSFSGDVVLTVSGKAGAEGTAKVATVNPMIKMTASTPEVNLGIKEQKVSDVEVVEAKADTILAKAAIGTPAVNWDTNMAFYLDQGFRFAKIPKVEVIEGDMVLEVKDVKIQAPASGQNLLIVPIRAASYKTPAKIKISDIYVTADRNAPVGDIILYAADTASFDNATGAAAGAAKWINAFNGTARESFRYDTPASVAIAKNVTVPPVETKGTTGGGSGTFVIGSNIYTVNGLTKIMDVAPYINNGRTFVPYRYLALALGVAEDDIVWDDATKKVTVTKGDIVVEGTIGSTTLTVNGEAVTMDVAPEIKNGRTMLPARYLTEALGGSVGWDQATKTVVFEM